ncbi:hypothetical protein [Facklamia hominis]|uniref:hypothetical protein n=1 Tax=Facklamia hominis TaxID=178214 RepID=UPI000C79FBEB|nr:hypothetical protein [Facklamia hominis]PKY93416.1 hypothetical protein CYJ56_02990 [Facklamia hominis]
MRIGEIVEKIRQQRTSSIDEFIDGALNKRSYQRFVNNENKMNISDFLMLLQHIKPTLKEINQLDPSQQLALKIAQDVQKAHLNGNTNQLIEIIDHIKMIEDSYPPKIYRQRLSAELRLSSITSEPVDDNTLQAIKKELDLNDWSIEDVLFFFNVLSALDEEFWRNFIDFSAPMLLKSHDIKVINLIKLYNNLFCLFLNIKDLEYAYKTLPLLDDLKPNTRDFYVSFWVDYLHHFYQLIIEPSQENLQLVIDDFQITERIGNKYFPMMIYYNYYGYRSLYDYPQINFKALSLNPDNYPDSNLFG